MATTWASLSALALGAAESTGETFPPEALREDLALLQQALERAHPGLLRYASREEIDAAFRDTKQLLNAPSTEPEFLRKIASLLALIRDDHTFAMPSSAYWDEHIRPTTYGDGHAAGDTPLFPFFVTVASSRLYITHNNSSVADIPRGTEIVRINARPVTEVLKELELLMPTSGFSSSFRRRHVEQFSPQQEFNYFCVYYALFLEAPSEFNLQIRRPGTSDGEAIIVPAALPTDLWARFRNRYLGTDDLLLVRDPPVSLTFPQDALALLRLTAFHEWRWNRAGKNYRQEISRIFETIRQRDVKTLVLDLRGNEGGSSVIAFEVLNRLAVAPYRIYEYKALKNYRFPEFTPYVRNPHGLDNLTEDLFVRTAEGRYNVDTQLPDETWSRPMEPSNQNFDGKLYVLVDGATGSAAAQLATILRVNRRNAIFVGEECGGDMEGPISGSYLEMTLPNTKLRVDVPVIKKVLNLEHYPYVRGRGVMPDHEVEWTQNDIAQAQDPVLRFVYRHADAV